MTMAKHSGMQRAWSVVVLLAGLVTVCCAPSDFGLEFVLEGVVNEERRLKFSPRRTGEYVVSLAFTLDDADARTMATVNELTAGRSMPIMALSESLDYEWAVMTLGKQVQSGRPDDGVRGVIFSGGPGLGERNSPRREFLLATVPLQKANEYDVSFRLGSRAALLSSGRPALYLRHLR